MSFTNNNQTSLYGFSSPLTPALQPPIVANRAPNTNDYTQIGVLWVYPATNQAWILVSIVSNVATWNLIEASGSAGVFLSLTVSPGPITLTGATTINSFGASAVNIGTSTYAGTITIGNAAHANTVNIFSPTIDIDGPAAGVITIGDTLTTGSITVGSSLSTGTITIGGTAETGTLTLGSSSATNSVLIGNGAGATTVSIGNANIAGAVNIGNALTTGSVTIANALTTGGLSLGSNAGAGSATTIYAGNTGGIILTGGTGSTSGTGNVQVVPGTVSSATASATLNQRVGVATFTGFTTAGAAKQAFTIVNSKILATSFVSVSVSNLNASTNGALMGIQGVTQAAGSIVVSCINNAAGALGAGDNVLISFVVNS
jgi:hypothetical protein